MVPALDSVSPRLLKRKICLLLMMILWRILVSILVVPMNFEWYRMCNFISLWPSLLLMLSLWSLSPLSTCIHTLPTNLDFCLQKICHYVTLLRFKFVIAKIRFLKAASKIISFIASNYMFKHNNSNILIHFGFSREWCNRTNRTPYIKY